MRVHHTPFFQLIVGIKCRPEFVESLAIQIFDKNFRPLLFNRRQNETGVEIEIDIEFPNKLIITTSIIDNKENNLQIEMAYFKVAGLAVDKNVLLKCLEHKPTVVDDSINCFDQLIKIDSHKTFVWNEGYTIVDLFHPNPFAWHLHLGNKIKFR